MIASPAYLNQFSEAVFTVQLIHPVTTREGVCYPAGRVFQGQAYQEDWDDRESSWIMHLEEGYHLEFYLQNGEWWFDEDFPVLVSFNKGVAL